MDDIVLSVLLYSLSASKIDVERLYACSRLYDSSTDNIIKDRIGPNTAYGSIDKHI